MRIAGGTAKRITKRIINFILVIWGVVTLSFCLQVFTGTDPAEMIVRKVNVFATEEQIQAVREELGLDAPFLERYTDYIKGVLTGDLGTAITNRQPVIENIKDVCNNKGYDIEFKNVVFSYNEEPVLKGVSFVAKQGEVTALVGPSGSGKSTASKLAARFWDADSGTITLGGVDVKTVEPETLFKNYAIVFQDVMLFDETVMENIRLGRGDATDEEVMAAARAAQCEEFIQRLPQGYQTNIGENGSALSGGERQRISIARALLKNAPIVLLDEATASMDAESETLIQDALSVLLKDKTVMVIAHRMRTVANADKIVVLDDGKVSEMGTPAELMKKGGLYAHLVELQQGK